MRRLAALAHELRSPVAALVAIADVARRRCDPMTTPLGRRRLIELAVTSCRDIERLVHEVSLVSLRRETFDPAELVADTVDAAALTGARVRTEVVPGLPAIHADPQRMRQALNNLIANAVGHSPPEAAAVVRACADRGAVRIAVLDKGSGIAPEDQERIFEPGVRLTDARTGQGIGLAIARAIAEAHGGTLEVESAPGEGATFTLVLPHASGPQC